MMNQKFKTAGKAAGGILLLPAAAAAFVVGTIVNTCIRIRNKHLLDRPIGQFVRIDGHNMNVLVKGQGTHTLVFLSGWGTTSPVLDFKALYSQLEKDFRIVVPEKFGYGFSDIVKTERSLAANVEYYREALSKLGIEGPYILCPHSLSGLETMLWAQKYPGEVEAIVGLDMTPANFTEELQSEQQSKLQVFVIKLLKLSGVSRFHKAQCLPHLTREEKGLLRELNVRNPVNYDLLSEMQNVSKACEEINKSPQPTAPCIHFIAQRDPGVAWAEKWRNAHQEYADASTNGKLVQLNCGHYVHDFEYRQIAEEIRELAKRL